MISEALKVENLFDAALIVKTFHILMYVFFLQTMTLAFIMSQNLLIIIYVFLQV